MIDAGVIERRSSRSNVLLQATLEVPDASFPVILRNLSQEGALVRGDNLPCAGTRVLFHRQGLCVPGQIVWVHGLHAGLAFDKPLYPRELLRHVPPTPQRPPPLELKRPGLGARPLTEAEQRLIEQWAADSPCALGD